MDSSRISLPLKKSKPKSVGRGRLPAAPPPEEDGEEKETDRPDQEEP